MTGRLNPVRGKSPYLGALLWCSEIVDTMVFKGCMEYCIGAMHCSVRSLLSWSAFLYTSTFVLEGCIFQYIRLLEGCISQYIFRICIRGNTLVLEGCISQYTRLLYWRDASLNTLGT